MPEPFLRYNFDPVLASRTITVPLIRTLDRKRANADPLDYKLWPCDPRALIDDLWALALLFQTKLAGFNEMVSSRVRLSGRSLEPWRSTLAVAAWLEQEGIHELWKRLEELSVSYQQETQVSTRSDITVLVVHALLRSINLDISDISDVSDIREDDDYQNRLTWQESPASTPKRAIQFVTSFPPLSRPFASLVFPRMRDDVLFAAVKGCGHVPWVAMRNMRLRLKLWPGGKVWTG